MVRLQAILAVAFLLVSSTLCESPAGISTKKQYLNRLQQLKENLQFLIDETNKFIRTGQDEPSRRFIGVSLTSKIEGGVNSLIDSFNQLTEYVGGAGVGLGRLPNSKYETSKPRRPADKKIVNEYDEPLKEVPSEEIVIDTSINQEFEMPGQSNSNSNQGFGESDSFGTNKQELGTPSKDFGSSNRGSGGYEQDFGTSNQELLPADEGYTSHSKGTGSSANEFGNSKSEIPVQDYGTQNQELGSSGNAFGTSNQEEGTYDQGYSTFDRGLGVSDQDFGTPNKAFGTPGQAYGFHDKGWLSSEHAFGTSHQEFGQASQGYDNVGQGWGASDNAFGTSNQGPGSSSNYYGNQGPGNPGQGLDINKKPTKTNYNLYLEDLEWCRQHCNVDI